MNMANNGYEDQDFEYRFDGVALRRARAHASGTQRADSQDRKINAVQETHKSLFEPRAGRH